MLKIINPEIRHYEESVFMGLNLRQTLWSAAAVVSVVIAYASGHKALGTETISWVCIIAAAPSAFMGFFTYDGMSAGKFLKAWLNTEFIQTKHRLWVSENRFWEDLKRSQKRSKRNHEIKRLYFLSKHLGK